jgi:hypothetical protein
MKIDNMIRINHKIGDNIHWKCFYEVSCGIPYNIEGFTIKAQLREQAFDENIIKSFSSLDGSIELVDTQKGEYLISGSTNDITPGLYYMDIMYLDNSNNILSSEIFEVYMYIGVTK